MHLGKWEYWDSIYLFIVIHTWVHFKSSTPYSANYTSWRLHYLWRPLHMSKCTQKHYITKEIVSYTLIGLLIRNHKFRTGSETFINHVKLFNVFLQVKINTFLPIHEKNLLLSPVHALYSFLCFFSLSHSFFILNKLANSGPGITMPP